MSATATEIKQATCSAYDMQIHDGYREKREKKWTIKMHKFLEQVGSYSN